MVCRDFILPEPASYVFFYAVFNLRNLLYIIPDRIQLHISDSNELSNNRQRFVHIYFSNLFNQIGGGFSKNIRISKQELYSGKRRDLLQISE